MRLFLVLFFMWLLTPTIAFAQTTSHVGASITIASAYVLCQNWVCTDQFGNPVEQSHSTEKPKAEEQQTDEERRRIARGLAVPSE